MDQAEIPMTIYQPEDWGEALELDGYKLVLTCGACPEQYDVMLDDERVAYFRLRHGRFTANCPDPGGDEVYVAHPEGDGVFEDAERERFLREALDAVTQWLRFSRSVKVFVQR
jgi:hypothetical protein